MLENADELTHGGQTAAGLGPSSMGETPNDFPRQTELVIGLVGAVGVDLNEVATKLAYVLGSFAYQSHDLHLSDQLAALDWDQSLPAAPYDTRVWEFMTAGNELCKAWEREDAFALLAINALTLERRKHTGDAERPSDRHAYVLRSLKRAKEAELLRDVYGSRFVLLSLYSPKAARLARLGERISESRIPPWPATPEHSGEDLVARDEKEADTYGQNVRGIFHQGDFFIDSSRDLIKELTRTFEILFGHPNRTPTRDEAGMFHAVAASRRSADLGRQVGAAICTPDGAVIAVGTNEVPRAGGGFYWEGDDNDAREFTFGYDTNDKRKDDLAERIADRLESAGLHAQGSSHAELHALIAGSELDDLIEYVRAVHAEMAALTDAARRGIAIAGGVLYVTTFPCHHCARHIVAAGIRKVVYVAPYAKSLAGALHGDAILVEPSGADANDTRIPFVPFVGVGPRRYLDLFEMPARKDRTTGVVTEFTPRTADPRIAEVEPDEMVPEVLSYIRREQRAIALLISVQRRSGLAFRDFLNEPPLEVLDVGNGPVSQP